MSNPMPREKELYEYINHEGISIGKDVWDFIYHRVEDSVAAIILLCQRWLEKKEMMPIQEAHRILLWYKDIKNVIGAVTSPSKESPNFPQFQNAIPINPILKEIITHQFGNDIYAAELMLEDSLDTLSPAPVSLETTQKILNRAQSIKEFLEKLSDVAQWKESEEKYHSFYDSFKDGMFLMDMKRNIIDTNQAYREMLGYTEQEIKGFICRQFTPEKWHSLEEDIFEKQILEKGYADEYEKEYIKKDGTVFPVSLKIWLIKDKEGKPRGMWGVVRDITTRKVVEKGFLDDFLELQMVVDKVSDGITLSDTKGHFEVFNSRMGNICGYTIEEANHSDFDTLIHPNFKDSQEALRFLNEIVAENGCRETETVIRAKDGSKKNILVSTSLTRYKERWMFLSVWRDITEHKRLQDALQNSESRFRRLFETAQDGILILDAETSQINEVNPFLVDMLGYSREEFLGKKLWDVGAFIDTNRCKTAFQQLQTQGYVRYEDLPLQTKDGRLINVEFVSNVYSVDHINVIQCNIRNITDRKMAETEREQLSKEMGQLILKDSHTGLYNHRYLKETLEGGLSQAERTFSPFSLIMMDLDYFKSINDVYGHVFGDLILRQFAQELTKIVRPYDTVIRYGGDEFIVLSPDTDKAGILALAERILKRAKAHNFGDKAHLIKLKLTLAVSSYPEDSPLQGMEMVDFVDKILNKAKESGGNRVFSLSDIKKGDATIPETSDIKSLKDKIARLTLRANQSLIEEIFAFAKIIELKDHDTGGHGERAVDYAVAISRELNLSSQQIELIGQAMMLHDLGKVGIREEILHKPSELTREEFEEVKRHPQIGVDIIRPIHSLHPIIPALLYHHERWDGKGYPYGFVKERIPLAARIIAVADVYEALISDRPYRKAFPKESALRMLQEFSGTRFEPKIVDAFLRVLERERSFV